MNDILLMLTVGFIAGGAVSSIIWAIIGAGRKKAAEADARARRDIMDTITSLLADADGIESKYRNGELTVENFRRNLGDRCNAALKVLRENMHSLDGFFVRYADQEIREYLRVADKPDRRKEKPVLDSQSGGHAEPSATVAPVGIGAAIQTFGEERRPAAPPALKVGDTPPEKSIEITGKPDLFEPSKPLMDSVGPKIALKPHPEPAPVVSVKAEPAAVFDTRPEESKSIADAVTAELERELIIDVKPELRQESAPVIDVKPDSGSAVVDPKPEPVIDVEPEPVISAKEESAFDLPVTVEASADVWAEQSIEEFEAAFAKFEEETEAPKADAPSPSAAAEDLTAEPAGTEKEERVETGVFPLHEALDDFETPTMEIPMSAVQALKVAEQPEPSIPPEPPVPVPVQADSPAPAPQKEEKKQDSSLGITGDDVSDALDNMFKF